MKKKWLTMIWFLGVLFPICASAGHKVCGGQRVPENTRRCQDGSMPMFVADEIRPYQSKSLERYESTPVRPNVTPDDQAEAHSPEFYFGVWRTRIPGAVWTSPSGYQGYDWLHVSAGVSVGDLIIKPDGTYVWNSYGGKEGRWVKGDSRYPVVLIDTVEKKRWKVGADPKHTGGRDIVMWDGKYYYYDGRR